MDGWMHATHDLIVYGRPYFDLHQRKDSPSQRLGYEHRAEHHQWYKAYRRCWTSEDPFPTSLAAQILRTRSKAGSTKAEEEMSWTSHDVLDRVWDELGPRERAYWYGLFGWLILNPQYLKARAGVDVLEGWIKRSNRSGTCESWKRCPALVDEYKRLRRYVEAVVKKHPEYFR